MSRIETLYQEILSRFGVEPSAGDPAAGGPRASEERVEVDPLLGSPYECAPTTWGVEEIPAPAAPGAAKRHAPRGPERRRPRRRRRLEVDPEPAPRGLLLG